MGRFIHHQDNPENSVDRVLEPIDGARIGRTDESDFVLADPKMSRAHAQVGRDDNGYFIDDLGSTHGTFVNGVRVTRGRLTHGDRVQLGATVLIFEEDVAVSSIVEEVSAEVSPVPPARGADQRLRLVLDLADSFSDLTQKDAALSKLVRGIVEVCGADRGVLALCVPGGLRRIERSRAGGRGPVILAKEVLDATLTRKKAVLLEEQGPHSSLPNQKARNALAAPVIWAGQALGLIYVDSIAGSEQFSSSDLTFLASLAKLIASLLIGLDKVDNATRALEATQGSDAVEALAGDSPVMGALRAEVRKVGASSAHVFVFGESGTGKELVARGLHALSARSQGPLVTVNCAALPESMIESELFGHVRGAFTGALRDRRGKLALADRGTLFLDEVAELGAAAQAKLLRAVQEGEVQPIGDERTIRVDLRVISASHRDLEMEVEAGRFREDLYYRLHVVRITVPPLRDRGQDVLLLARSFLKEGARRTGKALVGFSSDAEDALLEYTYPGNVRELRNEVERAIIVADGPLVEVWDLSARLRGAPQSLRAPKPLSLRPGGVSLAARFAELEPTERQLVQEALTQARGNVSEAARILGITRIMMKRRIEKFGLGDGEGGPPPSGSIR